MPLAEVIEKEGYEERERELSEFATEVPAQDFSETKRVDEITRALKHGREKDSCIDRLVKASGCTLVKPYGFILDNAGNVVTIKQLINYLGVNTTGPVRCPHKGCDQVLTWDEIIFHLEQKYKSGHNMKVKDITKLFEEKFYNWVLRDGKFIK